MRARYVFEAIEDILKPKEGAYEELQKWTIKNLMKPLSPMLAYWLGHEENLSRLLNYKGDKEFIVGFDMDIAMEKFPGSTDTFDDIIEQSGFKTDRVISPKHKDDLLIKIGYLKDGSKVIYYQSGSIDGFIARKEWLKNYE